MPIFTFRGTLVFAFSVLNCRFAKFFVCEITPKWKKNNFFCEFFCEIYLCGPVVGYLRRNAFKFLVFFIALDLLWGKGGGVVQCNLVPLKRTRGSLDPTTYTGTQM